MQFTKNILLASAFAASALFADTVVRTPARSNLDFVKINQTIKETLTDVVRDAGVVKSLNYVIDAAGTDVEKNKFLVNIDAEMEKTAWSKDLVSASLMANVVDSADGKSGTDVSVAGTLKTDPLAFLHYAAKNGHTCPVPESIVGLRRVMAEEGCNAVEQILAAKTVDEIGLAMKKHLDDSRVAVRKYALGLVIEAKTIRNARVLAWMKSEFNDAKKLFKFITDSKFAATPGGFTIAAPSVQIFSFLDLKVLNLAVTADSVALSATVNTTAMSTLLAVSKPEMVRMLEGLQDNQEAAKENLRMHTRVWLKLIEKWFAAK